MSDVFTFQGQLVVEGQLGAIPIAFQLLVNPEADAVYLEDAARALGLFLSSEKLKELEETEGSGGWLN